MNVIQECEPASFVLIVVPTHTFMVASSTMVSIVCGCAQLIRIGVSFAIATLEGVAYVQHAKNSCVKTFLASSATDILFIDYDVGFDPEAMVQITQARRPVIAGVYPMKTDKESWPVMFDTTDVVETDADGFLSPRFLPGGFLRINRKVFDDFDCEEYLYKGETFKDFFRCGFLGGQFLTEDFDFCQRWKALGGRIHMIPDLTFTHTGMKTWTGNWANSARVEDPISRKENDVS